MNNSYRTFPGGSVVIVVQLVKNPPAVQKTWVRSLGYEAPLEKEKATHSSILALRIPWTVDHGATKSQARRSDFHFHFTFLKNKFGYSVENFWKKLLLGPPRHWWNWKNWTESRCDLDMKGTETARTLDVWRLEKEKNPGWLMGFEAEQRHGWWYHLLEWGRLREK